MSKDDPMTLDLDQLEKLAQAVSPKGWRPCGLDVMYGSPSELYMARTHHAHHAQFIAAANPATILELIKLARGGE